MSFKEVQSLDADNATAIGGRNKKTGKDNPKSAEGYFLGTRTVESKKSKDGTSKLHFLQTPRGNLGIWGKTDMDRKLEAVTPGTMIRISFDKMVPTPNGEMYKFKVEVDASNTIEVDTATTDATSSSASTDSNDYGSYNSQDENEEEENDDDYEQQEATQSAALSALERKAKVEALLKGNKSNKRN